MGNRFFQNNGIRGTRKSGVLALDAETGEILWKYNTDGEVMPTPVYYKDAIYIATRDKYLYKLNKDSGVRLHKENIGEKELGETLAPSGPIIVNDTLFIGSPDSNVYAIPLEDFENN